MSLSVTGIRNPDRLANSRFLYYSIKFGEKNTRYVGCSWGEEKFILKFSRKISTEENTLEAKAFVEADGTITFRSAVIESEIFIAFATKAENRISY